MGCSGILGASRDRTTTRSTPDARRYGVVVGEGGRAEDLELTFGPGAWIGQIGDEDDNVLEDIEPSPASRTFDATHWVGGLVTGVQRHPPEEGTVLLLHLGFDDELGFELLDNGAIQFRIPADALAARDWSRVTAEADSG